MQKTEVIHTRVSPEVKAECDYIFSQLGITTSYAISLFLSQVSLRKGIPFVLSNSLSKYIWHKYDIA